MCYFCFVGYGAGVDAHVVYGETLTNFDTIWEEIGKGINKAWEWITSIFD